MIVLIVFMLNISSLHICGAEASSSSSSVKRPSTFKCPFDDCGKFFATYSNLQQHTERNYGIKLPAKTKLNDEEYERIIGTPRPPKRASFDNTTFNCPWCTREFATCRALEKHTDGKHQRTLSTQDRLYQDYYKLYAYIRGLSTENPEATEAETDDAEMKDASSSSSSSVSQSSSNASSSTLVAPCFQLLLPDKPFLCPETVCATFFNSFGELKEHAQNTHNYTLRLEPPQ